MDTFMKVKELIIEQLSCEADAVIESASIKDDLGADSLDAVELIMAMEDAFGVTIPQEQAESIGTVGDAVRLVDGLLDS